MDKHAIDKTSVTMPFLTLNNDALESGGDNAQIKSNNSRKDTTSHFL